MLWKAKNLDTIQEFLRIKCSLFSRSSGVIRSIFDTFSGYLFDKALVEFFTSSFTVHRMARCDNQALSVKLLRKSGNTLLIKCVRELTTLKFSFNEIES